MKVLFHCYEFPPQAGGVGSYIYQMACGLRHMGHQSVIVTSRVPGLPEKENNECGLIYRIYDRSDLRSRDTARKVLDIARKESVDWIEGADHHGELAHIVSARNRPPVVVKIHGSNPIRVVNESQVIYRWQRLMIRLALLRNWHQTWAEKRSIIKADMAMIPSQRLYDELCRQGIPLPPHVATVPNPIVPTAEIVLQESDVPTVFFPARLEARKGIQYLPDIVSQVCARRPDVVFEIAGADVYARGIGSLKQWLVHRLGHWGQQVHFLGVLQPSEMEKAYRRAWTVILPSKWDNFPVSLLEAMMHGKAVVSTPCGGMPEMLAGTTCPVEMPGSPAFADMILAFLNDPALRELAGRSAREKVMRNYTPEHVVHQYLAAIQSWLELDMAKKGAR